MALRKGSGCMVYGGNLRAVWHFSTFNYFNAIITEIFLTSGYFAVTLHT